MQFFRLLNVCVKAVPLPRLQSHLQLRKQSILNTGMQGEGGTGAGRGCFGAGEDGVEGGSGPGGGQSQWRKAPPPPNPRPRREHPTQGYWVLYQQLSWRGLR